MSLSGLPTGTVNQETSVRTYPRTDANDAGGARRVVTPDGSGQTATETSDASELRRENEALRERLQAREERLQEVIDRYETVIETKDNGRTKNPPRERTGSNRTDGASLSLGERLLRAVGLRVR